MNINTFHITPDIWLLHTDWPCAVPETEREHAQWFLSVLGSLAGPDWLSHWAPASSPVSSLARPGTSQVSLQPPASSLASKFSTGFSSKCFLTANISSSEEEPSLGARSSQVKAGLSLKKLQKVSSDSSLQQRLPPASLVFPLKRSKINFEVKLLVNRVWKFP